MNMNYNLYSKPVVYCYIVKSLLQCELHRGSKDVDMTIFGVPMLNCRFKKFAYRLL